MISAAKPPKPMRMNQKAQLVPAAQYAEWHRLASATPGLSGVELAILDVVAEHYRRIAAEGFAGRITIEKMAAHIGVETLTIQSSIAGLVGRCLLAVQPGSGARPHTYLLALPKKLAVPLAAAAADDVPPL
jgi:hypothetical protein